MQLELCLKWLMLPGLIKASSVTLLENDTAFI